MFCDDNERVQDPVIFEMVTRDLSAIGSGCGWNAKPSERPTCEAGYSVTPLQPCTHNIIVE
jgi:hypothetical protein